MSKFAKELVRLNPDVILAVTTPATAACTDEQQDGGHADEFTPLAFLYSRSSVAPAFYLVAAERGRPRHRCATQPRAGWYLQAEMLGPL
jgi:hypothetical protein